MVEILNNPEIQRAVKAEEIKDKLRGLLADQLMSTKTWGDMDEAERRICVHHIVSQVASEEELRARLQSDLGFGYVAIEWHLSEPGDKTGEEARMLVKALGGLVSKYGALGLLMTMDDMF